jgi:hypothetical protein
MFRNLTEVCIANRHGFEVLTQYRKHKSKQAVKGLVNDANKKPTFDRVDMHNGISPIQYL